MYGTGMGMETNPHSLYLNHFFDQWEKTVIKVLEARSHPGLCLLDSNCEALKKRKQVSMVFVR